MPFYIRLIDTPTHLVLPEAQISVTTDDVDSLSTFNFEDVNEDEESIVDVVGDDDDEDEESIIALVRDSDDENEIIIIDDDDDDDIVMGTGDSDDLFARLGRAEDAVMASIRRREQLRRELEDAERQLNDEIERYRSMLPTQQANAFNPAITRNDVEGYIGEIATRIRNAVRRATTWGRGDHEYTRYYPT